MKRNINKRKNNNQKQDDIRKFFVLEPFQSKYKKDADNDDDEYKEDLMDLELSFLEARKNRIILDREIEKQVAHEKENEKVARIMIPKYGFKKTRLEKRIEKRNRYKRNKRKKQELDLMDEIIYHHYKFEMKNKGAAHWYLHHWRKKYFEDCGGMVLLTNGLYMQETRFKNYRNDQDHWDMDYLNESLFQLVTGIYLKWKKIDSNYNNNTFHKQEEPIEIKNIIESTNLMEIPFSTSFLHPQNNPFNKKIENFKIQENDNNILKQYQNDKKICVFGHELPLANNNNKLFFPLPGPSS